MASSSSSSLLLFVTLLLLSHSSHSSSANTFRPSTSEKDNLKSICSSTPYPDSCLSSLKLSISININPSILAVALRTLLAAISSAGQLSPLLSSSNAAVVEHQRGVLQDCRELHRITLSSLDKSTAILRSGTGDLSTVRTHLSAALTNKATCLEGLAAASGPAKPTLVAALHSTYAHVTNSLSLISGHERRRPGRRLYTPMWARGLLQSTDDGDYDPGTVLTVAADGSGNFTKVGDAVAFAPNSSDERTFIAVKAGVYNEHVEVPSYKTNLVLLGEGSDVTVITGNRSVGDGWTTFRSATVAISGEGFLARDIAIVNTAGPAKGQAVALRVNADLVAFYKCTFSGYQDTLYVHSFRQFYRECDISGTIDFVFGNSAVILQACNLIARLPLIGQSNAVTAQGRDDPNEDTGIVIQNCSVVASDDLALSSAKVRTYLGRPWKNYSRTVYMESYLDDVVDPAGWSAWTGDEGFDTLYYGEYDNSGPGSNTDGRVPWAGVHVMDYEDASNFTVSEFIYAGQWLDSTSFPYDDGI